MGLSRISLYIYNIYMCRFTHLGQLKGSVGMGGGKMVKGDPIYSLTANKDGLMVRFSNLESIEDFHEGLEKHLDWGDATGQWVHVKIVTTFGESMEVYLHQWCLRNVLFL